MVFDGLHHSLKKKKQSMAATPSDVVAEQTAKKTLAVEEERKRVKLIRAHRHFGELWNGLRIQTI